MSTGTPGGETILTAAVSLLTGGGLTKLFDALAGRKAREVRAMGDAISSLSDQLKAADERMDAFGDRLDDCHRAHEACERGRREDRTEIAGLRDEVGRLAGELPLTVHRLNVPKRGPGRGEGQ